MGPKLHMLPCESIISIVQRFSNSDNKMGDIKCYLSHFKQLSTCHDKELLAELIIKVVPLNMLVEMLQSYRSSTIKEYTINSYW